MEQDLKGLILSLESDQIILQSLLDGYSDYVEDDDEIVTDKKCALFGTETFQWANKLLIEDPTSRKERKSKLREASQQKDVVDPPKESTNLIRAGESQEDVSTSVVDVASKKATSPPGTRVFSKCSKCGLDITDGSAVKPEFSGEIYHRSCFVCSNGCGAVLAEIEFVVGPDNQAYCSPCASSKFSRFCCICEKAISSAPLSVFDKYWHKECFVCHVCSKPLYGQSFFAGKGQKPECDTCHVPSMSGGIDHVPTTNDPPPEESLITKKECARCHIALNELGVAYLSALGAYWHETCFTCSACPKLLVGGTFYCHDGKPYCDIHKFGG